MSFDSLDQKMDTDYSNLMTKIENNSLKNGIISMFQKGPPEDTGFTFCSKEVGYWTEEESKALKTVINWVLDLGWDSSGCSFMLRKLQYGCNSLQY